MAERPILFSAPMVRAILAGTKTQTRRVVKPQPAERGDNGGAFMEIIPSLLPSRGGLFDVRYALDNPRAIRCPYGQPGDRLWVRETFGHFERNENFKPGAEVFYRADGNCLELEPWRPSIHMPRWASRITLEITGVRVERLQDISEADAYAEGIQHCDLWGDGTPRGFYRVLWEQINGAGSWDASPWVWVVEFKRMEAVCGVGGVG